jgi:hypothetical protein
LLSSHPYFAGAVAAWLAALLGLSIFVIPRSGLESMVGATGLDQMISAAASPLGMFARTLIAIVAAAIGAALGWVIAKRFARAKRGTWKFETPSKISPTRVTAIAGAGDDAGETKGFGPARAFDGSASNDRGNDQPRIQPVDLNELEMDPEDAIKAEAHDDFESDQAERADRQGDTVFVDENYGQESSSDEKADFDVGALDVPADDSADNTSDEISFNEADEETAEDEAKTPPKRSVASWLASRAQAAEAPDTSVSSSVEALAAANEDTPSSGDGLGEDSDASSSASEAEKSIDFEPEPAPVSDLSEYRNSHGFTPSSELPGVDGEEADESEETLAATSWNQAEFDDEASEDAGFEMESGDASDDDVLFATDPFYEAGADDLDNDDLGNDDDFYAKLGETEESAAPEKAAMPPISPALSPAVEPETAPETVPEVIDEPAEEESSSAETDSVAAAQKVKTKRPTETLSGLNLDQLMGRFETSVSDFDTESVKVDQSTLTHLRAEIAPADAKDKQPDGPELSSPSESVADEQATNQTADAVSQEPEAEAEEPHDPVIDFLRRKVLQSHGANNASGSDANLAKDKASDNGEADNSSAANPQDSLRSALERLTKAGGRS